MNGKYPSCPILLIYIPDEAHWPAQRFLIDIQHAAQRCDASATVRVCRASPEWRGPDVSFLGEWRCAPERVHRALAALYCDLGSTSD